MKRIRESEPPMDGFVAHRLAVEAEAEYRHWEQLVSSIFIKAVLAHDREKIIELADAAAFFKGKLSDEYAHDPIRYKLLKLNTGSLVRKARTIKEIATAIEYRNKEDAKAGYPNLRRLCKQIGVRVRASQIRKK